MKRFRVLINVDVDLGENEFFAELPWESDPVDALEGYDEQDMFIGWQLYPEASVRVEDRRTGRAWWHTGGGDWEEL